MVIIPHSPYSPDLVPCDFLLFSKLILKLKRQHVETVPDIQTGSQTVLDSIKKSDFHGAFGAGKNKGIIVYVPKKTILKEMADKTEYVQPAFIFLPSPGTF
jgi:hypothetical protein